MTEGMSLGQRLKTLREQRQLSQVELAQKAHLTQPALSRIEVGGVKQPRLAVLQRLAEALEVSVGYLLGETRGAGAKEPMVGELIQSYESLPAQGRRQLVDYARFLRTQEGRSKARNRKRRNS